MLVVKVAVFIRLKEDKDASFSLIALAFYSHLFFAVSYLPHKSFSTLMRPASLFCKIIQTPSRYNFIGGTFFLLLYICYCFFKSINLKKISEKEELTCLLLKKKFIFHVFFLFICTFYKLIIPFKMFTCVLYTRLSSVPKKEKNGSIFFV